MCVTSLVHIYPELNILTETAHDKRLPNNFELAYSIAINLWIYLVCIFEQSNTWRSKIIGFLCNELSLIVGDWEWMQWRAWHAMNEKTFHLLNRILNRQVKFVHRKERKDFQFWLFPCILIGKVVHDRNWRKITIILLKYLECKTLLCRAVLRCEL